MTTFFPPTQERGVALVVALVLLVVMTLLGLAGMRTVTMQEKMSANSYDRSLAFQSAEAALRTGEALANAQATALPARAGFINSGLQTGADHDNACENISPCQNGLCNIPDKDCTPRWENSAFTGWVNATTANALAGDRLQYFVEFLGPGYPCDPENANDPCLTGGTCCSRYRITARSRDASGERAEVMLQSMYITP